jgi:translation elongation factor P/translation initiation factor 5A
MSKQVITKSAFLQDLEDGLTRKEMALKYETTSTAINKGIKIFGLENARAKKNYNIEFVDDTQFETVHITEKEIAEKAEAMEEIMTEQITDHQEFESPAIDLENLFGVTPEVQEQLVAESRMTYAEAGFPGINAVQD